MSWAFTISFVLITGSVFGQPSDTVKPVLAFGPWFKKKVLANEPRPEVKADSIKVAFYQARSEDLKRLSSNLETASDSSWKVFIQGYQSLVNVIEGDPRVEPYLITDQFLHRIVMQASRARKPLLASSFIDEARRIHPNGIYRINRNCKH